MAKRLIFLILLFSLSGCYSYKVTNQGLPEIKKVEMTKGKDLSFDIQVLGKEKLPLRKFTVNAFLYVDTGEKKYKCLGHKCEFLELEGKSEKNVRITFKADEMKLEPNKKSKLMLTFWLYQSQRKCSSYLLENVIYQKPGKSISKAKTDEKKDKK